MPYLISGKDFGKLRFYNKKHTMSQNIYDGASFQINDTYELVALGVYEKVLDLVISAAKGNIARFGIAGQNTKSYLYADRPKIKVIARKLRIDPGFVTPLLLNESPEDQKWHNKVTISQTDFEKTTIDVGLSMTSSINGTIKVFSVKTDFKAEFKYHSERTQEHKFSEITEVDLTIPKGYQAVATKKPTYLTTYDLKITGEIFFESSKDMPQRLDLDNLFETTIIMQDVGATSYGVILPVVNLPTRVNCNEILNNTQNLIFIQTEEELKILSANERFKVKTKVIEIYTYIVDEENIKQFKYISEKDFAVKNNVLEFV